MNIKEKIESKHIIDDVEHIVRGKEILRLIYSGREIKISFKDKTFVVFEAEPGYEYDGIDMEVSTASLSKFESRDLALINDNEFTQWENEDLISQENIKKAQEKRRLEIYLELKEEFEGRY